jgi:GTP-binding protein Era
MSKSGFVVIAGRPNAGKSTLMNRVLGAKVSIVTPKAQTTRDRVLGILTEPQGQMVFIDTPGIHQAKEGGINAYMMSEVKGALEGVACAWYLVDPASKIKAETVVLELLKAADCPVFLIWNKTDLKYMKPRELIQQVHEKARDIGLEFAREFQISAMKGRGLGELLRDTWQVLPEGPMHYPDPEQLSDRPTRFFVAEKVREQLLLQLGDELPYCCAVEIAKFEENPELPRIEAVIHVERDSQKGMVIGAGGKKIKSIGEAARKEIESFLGQKVFLGLKVGVLENWSRNAEALKRLGYNLPKARRSAG